MRRTVYVLTTGGTKEKTYSERTGGVANLDNKIDRYLSLLRLPEWDVNIVPVMNKDSLDMTGTDRVLILGIVRTILKENAPIVLTGAMTPLGFEKSDGLQNLTESLMAVQFLKPGVHIVMHGACYPVHRVRKDHARGRFVWTNERDEVAFD